MQRLAFILMAFVMIPSVVLAQSTATPSSPAVGQPTDQKKGIVADIARLGSSNKQECAAAVKALVAMGKPAAPALVTALSDPHNDVRTFAAEALRPILAADPANAPNCHDEAFWKKRIAQLKAGMPLDEALKVLLPELSPAERRKMCEGGAWGGFGGGRGTINCRLDDYWVVCLHLADLGHEKLHDATPDLFRSVRYVWVAPPAAYTGEWVTWFVNGQNSHEIQYRSGQYDGTFTAFNTDGSKCYQQHYTKGICQGADTGFHANGTKSYEGQYENGKQVGTWRWWKENGEIESVKDYGAGGGKTGN
jgi:hypothetical protein